MAKGLLLGLLLGFAAGWLAFGRVTAPTTGTAAHPNGAAAERPESVEPLLRPTSPPADPVPIVDLRAEGLRTATADEMHERWNASGNEIVTGASRREPERLTAEEGRALLERAREALRTRDASLFAAAVRGLARAEGDEIDRFLVEVMADVSLPMPGALGPYFSEALKDARVDGVARAARARFEAETAAERGWATQGWIDLVAAQGGENEVAWVADLAKTHRHHRVRGAAVDALARSPKPSAAQAFERWVEGVFTSAASAEDGLMTGDVFSVYADAHLDRALDLIEHFLQATGTSPNTRRSLWLSYATHAPEPRLARLESWLLRLEDVEAKADALYAVEALSWRGRDVSTFIRLIDDILGWLEANPWRRDDGTNKTRERIFDSLGDNRVAWTPRTLEVLERLGLDHLPKKIREHLASPWK